MQNRAAEKSTRTHFGFSLLEVLTVLAIIGIVTAIALPVFFSVREKGRRATCTANLRELGMAASLYLSDYDGRYPPCFAENAINHGFTGEQKSWRHLLSPYMGNAFPRCPSVLLPPYLAAHSNTAEASGYTYSLALTQAVKIDPVKKITTPIGKSETALHYPARVVVFTDARPGLTAMLHPDTATTFADLIRSGSTPHGKAEKLQILDLPPGATRHSGGANYAYADGHVEWHPMAFFYKNEKIPAAP